MMCRREFFDLVKHRRKLEGVGETAIRDLTLGLMSNERPTNGALIRQVQAMTSFFYVGFVTARQKWTTAERRIVAASRVEMSTVGIRENYRVEPSIMLIYI